MFEEILLEQIGDICWITHRIDPDTWADLGYFKVSSSLEIEGCKKTFETLFKSHVSIITGEEVD